MKKLTVLLAVLTISAFNPIAMAVVALNIQDGLSHIIDYDTYPIDIIQLDNTIANDPGTHAELRDGASLFSFNASNTASITITGGKTILLAAIDNATITITGGLVNSNFWAVDNSTCTMSGGMLHGEMSAYNNARITVSGGEVGRYETRNNGIIYLDGTGFEIDGTPLVNGDKLSDFVTLSQFRPRGHIRDYYGGTITGTFADGTA